MSFRKIHYHIVSRPPRAQARGPVPKMEAGLPKSICRNWFQTARCCCVQITWWWTTWEKASKKTSGTYREDERKQTAGNASSVL